MKITDFEVGIVYAYSVIEEACSDIDTDLDNHEVNEFGDELIGKNAIHIRYPENKLIIDVWFIAHSNGNQFYYKCVYKE